MAGDRVEVVNSKGCSRLSVVGISSSLSSLRGMRSSFEPISPASSAMSQPDVRASGPFAGLVICVTGLSKEARKQVMDATEKLGGQYSSSLHSLCTHLVVQSFSGRKFEHALKHGLRNGLFVVSLGWFVDSVKRNVRLSESLYSVKTVGESGLRMELNRLLGFTATENTCMPVGLSEDPKQYSTTLQSLTQFTGKENSKTQEAVLSRHSIFFDSDISTELRSKVVETATQEGATIVDHWFVGCRASHVVCEGPSVQRYLGHTDNVVTPLWILKTTKEKNKQRLVHLSADLARQVGMILENFQNIIAGKEANGVDARRDSLNLQLAQRKFIETPEERQKTVNLAKFGVRNRRGRSKQTFKAPIRPIAPSSLLESICWSISEPTSTAYIQIDSSGFEDVRNQHSSVFFDARGDGGDSEASFVNFRLLRGSEKAELIFINHFLTILFPIDRFGEMGPSSRTYFSDSGFTCLQVLDYIYAFYQENMSSDEVDAAIHTDSRYADRLRLVYASKETAEHGYVQFKRIDFLGSRKSFEMFKRVSGDNYSNVYELLIKA